MTRLRRRQADHGLLQITDSALGSVVKQLNRLFPGDARPTMDVEYGRFEGYLQSNRGLRDEVLSLANTNYQGNMFSVVVRPATLRSR